MSQALRTSFIVRNNSLNKQPSHRINSLEKQLNQFAQHKGKTDSCQAKEESSAIMELLQIKDQHVQWKDKYHNQKHTKSKNTKQYIREPDRNASRSIMFNSQQKIKQDFRQQQHLLSNSPFLERAFTKRTSHQELKNKNSQFKKSRQFSQYHTHKMLRQSNTDNFLMNRTNYRNKNTQNVKSSNQKNPDFSLTQRLNNRFLPKQTFYERQLDDNFRVNSNFEFYRNKSPLDKNGIHEQENLKKMDESRMIQNNKSIRIQANKSITVRQMLSKINSHEDISIAESSTQPKKLRSLLDHPNNRQPFDPYTKKTPRQHYKKFTPFKMEEERKLQYSLQRLEQQIRRNPEIDEKWEQIEIRYLEKPTYCSWVERNREKIKRKRNHPLTVRPLKLLN